MFWAHLIYLKCSCAPLEFLWRISHHQTPPTVLMIDVCIHRTYEMDSSFSNVVQIFATWSKSLWLCLQIANGGGEGVESANLARSLSTVCVMMMMAQRLIAIMTNSHHGGNLSAMLMVGICQWLNSTIDDDDFKILDQTSASKSWDKKSNKSAAPHIFSRVDIVALFICFHWFDCTLYTLAICQCASKVVNSIRYDFLHWERLRVFQL